MAVAQYTQLCIKVSQIISFFKAKDMECKSKGISRGKLDFIDEDKLSLISIAFTNNEI